MADADLPTSRFVSAALQGSCLDEYHGHEHEKKLKTYLLHRQDVCHFKDCLRFHSIQSENIT